MNYLILVMNSCTFQSCHYRRLARIPLVFVGAKEEQLRCMSDESVYSEEIPCIERSQWEYESYLQLFSWPFCHCKYAEEGNNAEEKAYQPANDNHLKKSFGVREAQRKYIDEPQIVE